MSERSVWVDGRPIPTLTDLDTSAPIALWPAEQTVDKYQIVEAVWGETI